jgi:hypothetical protein
MTATGAGCTTISVALAAKWVNAVAPMAAAIREPETLFESVGVLSAHEFMSFPLQSGRKSAFCLVRQELNEICDNLVRHRAWALA